MSEMFYEENYGIAELKKEKNAVILAHNYQPAEIQDIADFTGDSLELSRKARTTAAEVIIFCGVDFMAETAKVLSPDKKVILPGGEATCPMADMISAEGLKAMKNKYPDAAVVTYVNTSAAVKAQSDICCTSSNAVKITASCKEEDIIFIPDMNLGSYVSTKVNKNMIIWPGYCPVHDSIGIEDVMETREKFPEAVFMAHPECGAEVLDAADYVVSTGQMFLTVEKEKAQTFIVGTEEGMLYALGKRFPEKEFVPAAPWTTCQNMKKISIECIFNSLDNLSPETVLAPEVIAKASLALNRMLSVG
ncbi:MAG: quinolinate synthase NadA [Elusimicrobiota bacterium]